MKIDLGKLKDKKTVKELLEFGIININKPSGPTSFDVSEFVMKTLGLRKTSHFGTLDPKVTGVLPVALNRGCKLTGFFLGEDKEYIGIMRIHENLPIKEIEKAIEEKFTGKIMQLPPVKSRVARINREREVKKFEILEKDGQNILFHVECQGGTYIRKLVSDLGDYLKIGAHMLELRRIRAGIFTEDDKKYPSIDLYELEKCAKDEKKLREIIIPGEVVSELYPVVEIKNDSAKKILMGQPIYEENLAEKNRFNNGSRIAVFSDSNFIGIYNVINEDRIFAKPEFVFQTIQG
jgi:H/ACA ribonucleoprotein complex subunit 4